MSKPTLNLPSDGELFYLLCLLLIECCNVLSNVFSRLLVTNLWCYLYLSNKYRHAKNKVMKTFNETVFTLVVDSQTLAISSPHYSLSTDRPTDKLTYLKSAQHITKDSACGFKVNLFQRFDFERHAPKVIASQ